MLPKPAMKWFPFKEMMEIIIPLRSYVIWSLQIRLILAW